MQITYNEAETSVTGIVQAVSTHLKLNKAQIADRTERRVAVGKRVVTRISHLGMFFSLAASLIAAVPGGKGLH